MTIGQKEAAWGRLGCQWSYDCLERKNTQNHSSRLGISLPETKTTIRKSKGQGIFSAGTPHLPTTMYTINKGPSKIVAKTRRGESKILIVIMVNNATIDPFKRTAVMSQKHTLFLSLSLSLYICLCLSCSLALLTFCFAGVFHCKCVFYSFPWHVFHPQAWHQILKNSKASRRVAARTLVSIWTVPRSTKSKNAMLICNHTQILGAYANGWHMVKCGKREKWRGKTRTGVQDPRLIALTFYRKNPWRPSTVMLIAPEQVVLFSLGETHWKHVGQASVIGSILI